MNLTCENIDIFNKLNDRDFFYKFIEHQYELALKNTALVPVISEYACNLAHNQFCKDNTRIANSEFGDDGKLDHFKMVSLLVFWLRRHSPVGDIALKPKEFSIIKSRAKAKPEVAQYYLLNPMIAFDIGFRILRAVEMTRSERESIYRRPTKELIFNLMQDETRDVVFLQDLYMVLSNKSLSPHAIWAIYRSLFHQILP